MAHVESNRCPKIKMEHFQANRARKMLLRDYLADPEVFEQSAKYQPMLPSNIPLVEPSLMDEDASSALQAVTLAPVPSPTGDLASHYDEKEREPATDMPKRSTAESGTQRRGPFGLPLPDLSKMTTPRTPETPAQDVASHKGGASMAESDLDPMDPLSKRFAPRKYLHPVTGKYMCPRPLCGYVSPILSFWSRCSQVSRSTFKSLQGFKEHLLSPSAHSENRVMYAFHFLLSTPDSPIRNKRLMCTI